MGKIIKPAIVLMLFCAISAGLLAYVYLFTQAQIVANLMVVIENARKEVLGGNAGKVSAVAPRGYGGEIKMLVGIDKQGKITGVKILDQRETPGLGANAIKGEFLNQFKGKSTQDTLEPKKDIDAITGATITSRAVCNGVKEALGRTKP